MTSSQPGRGRGRSRIPTSPIDQTPCPSIAAIAPTQNSTTSIDNLPSTSQLVCSTGRGRGRGLHRKPNEVAAVDLHPTASASTVDTFKSITRSPKPDEHGTIGEEIQLTVTYSAVLQYPKQNMVYQYYFEIRNSRNLEIHHCRRRALYLTWLHKLCQNCPNINRYSVIYDNRTTILVFDQPLPNINEDDCKETISGLNALNRMENFKVTIKRVGCPIDFSLLRSPDAFIAAHRDLARIKQVLSIVLHEHCSSHADFVYYRSFYAQPTSKNEYGHWDLGMGKALWRGFYSCLMFANGTNKLLVNLDVSHSVFMKRQPFLEFLREVMRHSPCGKLKYGSRQDIWKVDSVDVLHFLDSDSNRARYDGEVDFLLKQCQNLRVSWDYMNAPRFSDIRGLGESASCRTFEWKQGGNRIITVQKYYYEQYKYDLQYPFLPLLQMGNKSFIPMELVTVEPVRTKKITDEQRALLCKYSTSKPHERRRAIEQVRCNPKQQCFEDDPYVHAYNLRIDRNMLVVPARILPMPRVTCSGEHQGTTVGTHQSDVLKSTRIQFYKATDFPLLWAMINLSSSLNEKMCEAFYYKLRDLALHGGIKIPQPEIYKELRVQHPTADDVVNTLKQIIDSNPGCRFIIFILPDSAGKRAQPYGSLKSVCELEIGIVTQMVQSRTVRKCLEEGRAQSADTLLNILLLKMNAKLNGTNSIIQVQPVITQFFTRGHRIMYVGADLSHGVPGLGNRQSVVAVVASADDVPSRYFREIYMQERPVRTKGEGRECIVDMKDIMISLIRQYEQHRGYPPSAIVIYRNGISIGEFDTVFIYELNAIRQACIELSPVYQPKLTYILVNKQHHTRFFSKHSDMKVIAGTVVDSTEITDATLYDFYLNSHHGHLGTSRPSHYRVLYDDNKLKPDEVQMLTYALCFTYARWTHPVSTPAPVKYADILAFRAGFYIDKQEKSSEEAASVPSPTTTDSDAESYCNIIRKRIVISPRLAPDCPFFL